MTENSEQPTVFPADLQYVAFKNVLPFLAARHQIYITPRTWYRWEAQRVGPPRLRIGRSIVYRVSDLKDWVDSHLEHARRPRGRRG
jgi:predicted DNA-binding transcriptional regulator AlpA